MLPFRSDFFALSSNVIGPGTRLSKGVTVRCCTLLLAAMLHSFAWGQSSGLPDPQHALKGEALIQALKAGGYSLLFRHAAREPNVMEYIDKMVMADCATQIPLGELGRAQSRSMAAAMRKLGIPLGEVIASPYCRTMDTARLIAGRVRADDAVAGRDTKSRQIEAPTDFAPLAKILATQPAPGTNRLIVGHVSGFSGVAGAPYLQEGEAGIFRAVEGHHVLVARLRVEDWQAHAAPANGLPATARSAIPDGLLALRGLALVTTLRFGGYTLFFRHGAIDPVARNSPELIASGCSGQDSLSPGGREQASRIGQAIAAMQLPVAEVVTAPQCPTMETARLIAGGAAASAPIHGRTRLFGSTDYSYLETLLAAPAALNGLRIIVGDGVAFKAVAGGPPLEEGESAVLRTTDAGGWIVLARVSAAEWAGLPAAAGFVSAPGK